MKKEKILEKAVVRRNNRPFKAAYKDALPGNPGPLRD